MLYYRLTYMLSMLYVRLTIKVKVGIPPCFKVGWYPHKITGSSHLISQTLCLKKFDENKIGLKFSRVITKKIISRKTVCIANESRLN